MPQQVIPIPRHSPWRWYGGMALTCLLVYLAIMAVEWWKYQPPRPQVIYITVTPTPTPTPIAQKPRPKATPDEYDKLLDKILGKQKRQ